VEGHITFMFMILFRFLTITQVIVKSVTNANSDVHRLAFINAQVLHQRWVAMDRMETLHKPWQLYIKLIQYEL